MCATNIFTVTLTFDLVDVKFAPQLLMSRSWLHQR